MKLQEEILFHEKWLKSYKWWEIIKKGRVKHTLTALYCQRETYNQIIDNQLLQIHRMWRIRK